MSNYRWLIDAGHGGLVDGKYATAPGKMFVFPEFTFEEGVNNRIIAKKLAALLDSAGIEFALVYDENLDTLLHKRINIANKIHQKDPRCIFISIHSDAMPEGAHGKASGFSVWTSPGQTKSDKVANIFFDCIAKELKEFKGRQDKSDMDADKEAKFSVLTDTHCPAVLTENLFYDNKMEAEFLMSEVGQTRIAKAHFDAIMAVETLKPI